MRIKWVEKYIKDWNYKRVAGTDESRKPRNFKQEAEL